MSKILVVDDDPAILLTLEATLSAAGHEVTPCSNPREVSQLIATGVFAGLILDLAMPELSGFEVLTELRAKMSVPPTLILSSRDSREDRVRGLREGADDYLVKPFDPEELVLRLERLLAQNAPRPGEIASDFATYPIWDLLQMLDHSQRTGQLRARTPIGTFQAELKGGKVVRAALRHLRGDEALIALLCLNEGSFNFAAVEAVRPSTAEEAPIRATQDLLFKTAWLNDELTRSRSWLPPPHSALELGPQATDFLPPSLDGLPADLVLQAVHEQSGITLHQLELAVAAAPRSLELTVARLVEAGLLLTRSDARGPDPVRELVRRMDEVVGQVLHAAQTQTDTRKKSPAGSREALHLLLLAQPLAWGSLLRLLQAVPDAYASGGWQQLKHQLTLTQGGTCTLEQDAGRLVLHFQVLTAGTRRKAETILPLCHGVILWLDHGTGASARDALPVIQKAATAAHRPHGWLIVEPGATLLPDLTSYPRWQLQPQTPADAVALLELFR